MIDLANHHRSGLICDKKNRHHRTILACVAGGCHIGGCFCWRCFPCVYAIVGCIGDGLGMCHLLIAQHDHLWFLHVSSSYWTTCRVPVVPHVRFLLAHMSCWHWIMSHFLIGPYVTFLLVHVSVSYLTTRHGAICPCVIFLYVQVAWRFPSTCLIFNSPHVMPWPIMCHALDGPCVAFLFDHVACPSSNMCRTIITLEK
jgi:hypothetical protein